MKEVLTIKRFYWAVVLVMIATAFVGCSRQQSPFGTETGTRTLVPLNEAHNVTVALLAGRALEVGTVTCWIDGNVLHIDYATTGGWMLSETHLVVAGSVMGIPVTRSGNPVPGRFPFKATHDPCVPAFGYAVDLDAQGLAETDVLYVAAHAAVQEFDNGVLVREEGAWAEGERTRPLAEGDRIERKGNWAMYFTVNVLKLRGLLLWNKLGSQNEVGNSRVGPDGIIHGALGYMPCVYGNGFQPMPRTGDHNVPDNFIDYPGVGLRPQGCIEFWYHPTWSDWSVGHVVDILAYGLPTAYQMPVKLGITIHYNDWQDSVLVGVGNVVNGETDHANVAGVSFRPSATAGWSTTEPFHIAIVWDGAAPNRLDRARVYLNGNRVGTSTVGGNPTFTGWPEDFSLWLGSRLYSGDWNRHQWEGLDGIVDNVKVWDYAKTDFSDRFHE